MQLRKLENILLENNLIPMKSLQLIKRECEATSIRFADGLLSLGLITETELTALLAANTHYPIVTSQDELELLTRFDSDIFLALHCVPISLLDKTLTVGMVDPTDYALREQLKFLIGCHIKPVIMKKSIIKGILKELDPNFSFAGQNNFEIFLRKLVHQNVAPAPRFSPQNLPKPAAKTYSEPVESSDFSQPLSQITEVLMPMKEYDSLNSIQTEDETVLEPEFNMEMENPPVEESSATEDDVLSAAEVEVSPERSIDALFENLSEETKPAEEYSLEIDPEVAVKFTAALNRLIMKITRTSTIDSVNALLKKNMDFEMVPAILLARSEMVFAGWKKDVDNADFKTGLELTIEEERRDLGLLEGPYELMEKQLKNGEIGLLLLHKNIAHQEVILDQLGKLLEKLHTF